MPIPSCRTLGRSLAASLALAAWGCWAQPEPAAGKPALSLRADYWCPHTCSPGATPGYLVEVVRAALPQYRHDYELLNWARLRKATSAPPEPVLLVLGLAGTDEQAERYRLTEAPIAHSPFCFFTLESAPSWHYQGPKSLGSMRVGVTLDYQFDDVEFQQWLNQPTNRRQITRVGGERAVERHVEMLAAKRSDVVVDDQSALRWAAAHRQPAVAVREAGCLKGDDQLHVGIPRTDPRGKAVLQDLIRGLAHLRATGQLQPILARYGVTP